MKNNTKKNGKKMKTIICGATILGVVGVSGIFAYLTDTDSKTNNFTVGDVDIELLEPSWEVDDSNDNGIPDASEDLTANQVIPKDPKVHNIGKNPAYVFLKVQVPQRDVVIANETGTKQESKTQELFTYKIDDANWGEIITAKEGEGVGESVTHVYYYKKALDAEATTETALFNNVQLKNIIENQLDGQKLDIQIDAYAIQADNIVGVTPSDELTEEQANKIYNIYTAQNPAD